MGVMEPTIAPQTQTLETPHIVRTSGICGGKPRIDGHRIKVEHIAICHERMGMNPDEIVNSHPTITLAQVHAALAYYFEHNDAIDADIEEGERFVDELKAKSPPSKLQKILEAGSANGSDDPLPLRSLRARGDGESGGVHLGPATGGSPRDAGSGRG
jgi:uncharacterized protein (DUF433 family)